MPSTRKKEAASARRGPLPAAPAARSAPSTVTRTRPEARKALLDYLAKENLSHAEFAAKIGVTRSHVGMLLAGSPPSLPCATRIEKLTGILCADWLDEAAA